MNDSRSAASAAADLPHDPQRRKEEFRTWLFLSLIMAPVLSVLIVAGYGLVVWMYQLFAGPAGA